MSININKYNNPNAFAVDNNRPVGESCVSLVNESVVYDGKNVIKTERQLGQKEVCMIVKDLTDGTIKYIPVHTFDPDTLDTNRYQLKDWIRFGECMGKHLKIYKTNADSTTWAAPNRYRISIDNSDAGGFDWAISINGKARTGNVSWTKDQPLSEVASQLNGVYTGITCEYVDGEQFIRVTISSYTNSTFTISNEVGAVCTDLSLYVKINGVEQAQTHRTFMAQSVASLFPDLGYLPVNSMQYGVNGLNMGNLAGGNLANYKSYYRTSGSAEWKAEAAGRMNEAAFNQCADGTIGGADGIALYNIY